MGVMECNRVGCDRVLCERHSKKHGYLCDYCFEELVSLGAKADVEEFMKSEPKDLEFEKEYSFKKWDRVFRKD